MLSLISAPTYLPISSYEIGSTASLGVQVASNKYLFPASNSVKLCSIVNDFYFSVLAEDDSSQSSFDISQSGVVNIVAAVAIFFDI